VSATYANICLLFVPLTPPTPTMWPADAYTRIAHAVNFTNATSVSLQLRPMAGSDEKKFAACCKPMTGEVSSFDVMFAMYSGSNCEAPTKLCSFPAAVRSVWVCGCNGNKCYGEMFGPAGHQRCRVTFGNHTLSAGCWLYDCE